MIDSPCDLSDIALDSAIPHIFASSYQIDSLTTSIIDASSTQYISSSAASSDIDIRGNGSASISWRNTGAASFDDFYQAIQSVSYHNTDPNAMPDTIEIAFYIYDGDHVSDVATAYLHLGFDIAQPYMNMMLHLCPEQGLTDLNDFIDEELIGGTWSPDHIVDPIIVTNDTYYYIIDNACSIDTISYYLELSPAPTFSSIDTLLCHGDSLLHEGVYYYEATTVSSQLQDIYGCDSSTIEYHLSFSPPHIDTTRDTSLCYGDSILIGADYIYTDSEIEVTISNQQGCDSISTLFRVHFGEEVQSFDIDTMFCQGDSILLADAYHSEPSSVAVSTLDRLGCDSIMTTYHLSYFSTEVYDIIADGTLCTDSVVHLSVMGENIGNIIWNEFTDSVAVLVNQAGNYNAYIVDDYGCTHMAEIEIPEAMEPIIEGEMEYSFVGQDTTITPDLAIDSYESITWTPSNGLSCTDCLTPSIYVDSSTSYQISVINENGCSAQATINISQSIQQENDLVLANIFSPNAQHAKNRFFYLQHPYEITYDMSIYDRWGSQVFAGEDLLSNISEQGWDGNFNGQSAMTGVYVYHIRYEINGVPKSTVGTLTMMR